MRSIKIKIKDKSPAPFRDEVVRHLRNILNALEGHPDYDLNKLDPDKYDLFYYDKVKGASYVTGKVTIK